MAVDEATRPRQHSRRQIDAIDVAGVTNRRSQGGQIAAGAAADLENPVSGLQFERRDCLLAKFSRNKQQPFEQGDEPRQMIIPPRNERAVAIDPHRHGTPPTFLILYADVNLLLCRYRRNCEAKSGQLIHRVHRCYGKLQFEAVRTDTHVKM
jgi:hypothetical protein